MDIQEIKNLIEENKGNEYEYACLLFGDDENYIYAKKCRIDDSIHTVKVSRKDHDRWKSGELIQTVWPTLSVNDRVLIKDGITEKEWDAKFPEIE